MNTFSIYLIVVILVVVYISSTQVLLVYNSNNSYNNNNNHDNNNNNNNKNDNNDYFAPIQLGVGVIGGCQSAVHATRRFMESMPNEFVIAKLDFTNAFNNLRRDAMLEAV